MMTIQELKTNHPDLVEQIRAEAIAKAKAEARAAGEKAGAGAAATAERERILAIVTHPEAKGREELARRLAAIPAMSRNAAVQILGVTPKTAAAGPVSEFERLMLQLNPSVSPDAGEVDTEAEVEAYLARMKAYDITPSSP